MNDGFQIPDYAKDVHFLDLNPEYREIAECIGLEPFMKLCWYSGGTCFYVPALDSVLTEARNRKIRMEFDGTNTRKLAMRYKLTDRRIRDILKEGRKTDK